MSWRAAKAVAATSSGLWSSIVQAQRLIWLFLPTRGPLPLLELVAESICHLAFSLQRHWLGLPEFFTASLFVWARHILSVVARPEGGINCPANLLNMRTFFALIRLDIVLLLSSRDGACH